MYERALCLESAVLCECWLRQAITVATLAEKLNELIFVDACPQRKGASLLNDLFLLQHPSESFASI